MILFDFCPAPTNSTKKVQKFSTTKLPNSVRNISANTEHINKFCMPSKISIAWDHLFKMADVGNLRRWPCYPLKKRWCDRRRSCADGRALSGSCSAARPAPGSACVSSQPCKTNDDITWLLSTSANEGPVRIQHKCLVPIYVFPEMKLCSLVISKTEL